MTTDELVDIRWIAAAVARIESEQQRQSERLAKVEQSVERWSGALRLAQVALTIFGFGGITAVVYVMSARGAP